jgi:hypothetical protein
MSNDKEIPKQTIEQDVDPTVPSVTPETIDTVCSELNSNPDVFIRGTMQRLEEEQGVLFEGIGQLIDSNARDDEETMKMAAIVALTYNFIKAQTETEQGMMLPFVTEDALPDIDTIDSLAESQEFAQDVLNRLITEQPAMSGNLETNIHQFARDDQEKANLWASSAVTYGMIASQIEGGAAGDSVER